MAQQAANVAGQPRRRLGLDERREALLGHAVELFNTRPYDDVSVDDIAGAAGVSKGLLYHYFANKRELHVACVQLSTERFVHAIDIDDPDPQTRLCRSLTAYVDYVAASKEGYRAVLLGGAGSDPAVVAVVERARVAAVQRILADGGRPASPAVLIAIRGWIGFCEAAALAWLAQPELPRHVPLNLMMDAFGTVQRALAADLAPPDELRPGGASQASAGPTDQRD